MVKLEIELSDIDYDQLLNTFLPKMQEKLGANSTLSSLLGGGLAGRMLEQALRIALESDCVSVRVDTHRGNAAMRRFLEKSGFVQCGLVRYAVKAGDPVRVAYEKLM